MTTPVFMSGSDSNATMAFVLPAKLKGSGTPKPTDGSVKVRELKAGRFAVLRYGGGRNAKNEAESLSRLKNWMVEEGLSVLSAPVYAYFDPPWTLGFLRRNEVMVRGFRPIMSRLKNSHPNPEPVMPAPKKRRLTASADGLRLGQSLAGLISMPNLNRQCQHKMLQISILHVTCGIIGIFGDFSGWVGAEREKAFRVKAVGTA
jgi:hypothetical protein